MPDYNRGWEFGFMKAYGGWEFDVREIEELWEVPHRIGRSFLFPFYEACDINYACNGLSVPFLQIP